MTYRKVNPQKIEEVRAGRKIAAIEERCETSRPQNRIDIRCVEPVRARGTSAPTASCHTVCTTRHMGRGPRLPRDSTSFEYTSQTASAGQPDLGVDPPRAAPAGPLRSSASRGCQSVGSAKTLRRRTAFAGFPQARAETPASEQGTWFDTCPGRGANYATFV
jgi:hypothetical protein